MQYEEEMIIGGGTALALALVFKGDNTYAVSVFSALMAYVFGRTRKVNGAMAEALNRKK